MSVDIYTIDVCKERIWTLSERRILRTIYVLLAWPSELAV